MCWLHTHACNAIRGMIKSFKIVPTHNAYQKCLLRARYPLAALDAVKVTRKSQPPDSVQICDLHDLERMCERGASQPDTHRELVTMPAVLAHLNLTHSRACCRGAPNSDTSLWN